MPTLTAEEWAAAAVAAAAGMLTKQQVDSEALLEMVAQKQKEEGEALHKSYKDLDEKMSNIYAAKYYYYYELDSYYHLDILLEVERENKEQRRAEYKRQRAESEAYWRLVGERILNDTSMMNVSVDVDVPGEVQEDVDVPGEVQEDVDVPGEVQEDVDVSGEAQGEDPVVPGEVPEEDIGVPGEAQGEDPVIPGGALQKGVNITSILGGGENGEKCQDVNSQNEADNMWNLLSGMSNDNVNDTWRHFESMLAVLNRKFQAYRRWAGNRQDYSIFGCWLKKSGRVKNRLVAGKNAPNIKLWWLPVHLIKPSVEMDSGGFETF
ncbi:MAG: hypothetical protein GY739_06905 [Mesoflavibacter sp.]|nr:hypothetical protein [Mesoflavibacter sp.]